MSAIPMQHRANLGRVGIFLAGALATALIGAPVAYYFAKQANTTLLVQQQRVSEVQSFESTGAEVDNSLRQFSDALASQKDVESARDRVRASVGSHSSIAFSMRDTIGSDYPGYMAKVNEFRSFADNASTPREGVVVWQSAVDMIALRKRISDRIKQDIEDM